MSEPADLKYTEDHEWARLEGGEATVGIADYAQDQLGDIVYVDLPEPGSVVNRGEVFGAVESVKAVADLFSPLSGEILAVNEALADAPEKVNEDPYGAGWMVKLKLAEPGELEGLMDAPAYESYVEQEKGKG